MGILSGLKSLGLGNLEGENLFEQPKKDEVKKKNVPVAPPKPQEKDLIYDKAFVCPVCDSQFTAKLMKTSKAKLLRTDQDLRAKYDGIDAAKYEVVLCPICGYAALIRYFTNVTSMQAKQIREKISQMVRLKPCEGEVYSYRHAMDRYKLALASAMVKHAKTSEKAYICLKNAWLVRGYSESLKEEGQDEKLIQELDQHENELMESAYKGFKEARQSEPFPICGMNTVTVDYLMAVLAIRFQEYDLAARMISSILGSSAANSRIKDKARDMKEQVMKELRKK